MTLRGSEKNIRVARELISAAKDAGSLEDMIAILVDARIYAERSAWELESSPASIKVEGVRAISDEARRIARADILAAVRKLANGEPAEGKGAE